MAERIATALCCLSDQHLHFQKALNLPTFESEGKILLKRLTIVARKGVIQTVHYPIFPSDGDAAWVLNYLQSVP
jgi:peroxiredoxin